jgi:hypothetical protein
LSTDLKQNVTETIRAANNCLVRINVGYLRLSEKIFSFLELILFYKHGDVCTEALRILGKNQKTLRDFINLLEMPNTYKR